jgi:hypothetical protein
MGKKAEAEAVVLRTSLSVKMLGFERKGAAIQGCRNMKELPLTNNGLRRHGKISASAFQISKPFVYVRGYSCTKFDANGQRPASQARCSASSPPI